MISCQFKIEDPKYYIISSWKVLLTGQYLCLHDDVDPVTQQLRGCQLLDTGIGVIYINKVAVCLFVCLSGTFSFTIVMITQVLVQTLTTRGKTTNLITYFCVTITNILVQHQGKISVTLPFQYPNLVQWHASQNMQFSSIFFVIL